MPRKNVEEIIDLQCEIKYNQFSKEELEKLTFNKEKENNQMVSVEQLELLNERVMRAEESDATKSLSDILNMYWSKNDYKPLRIGVVGAGGSYPAAIFARYALGDEFRTPYIDAMTPQTALRKLLQYKHILNCDYHIEYDVMIGISYSGTTPDIKAVFNACNDETINRKIPFILVTNGDKNDMISEYGDIDNFYVVSYRNAIDTTRNERGLISMASTLIPCVLFDDNWTAKLLKENQEALQKGKDFVSGLDIKTIAKDISRNPVVHVFYDYETEATARDIESKFTECGMANVVLHEKKNFSHGRYVLLYRQHFGLVINLTRYSMAIPFDGSGYKKEFPNDYEKKLEEFLLQMCKDCHVTYLALGTVAMMPSQWNIETMSIIPYLVTRLGVEMDLDISKPIQPFPTSPSVLFDYRGEF